MAMDPTCAANLQSAIATIDNILTHPEPTGPILRKTLKKLFGLDGLEHDEDFASILSVREASLVKLSTLLRVVTSPESSGVMAGQELGPRSGKHRVR